MTLAIVLLGGWFVLSVVCFAMGTGMLRPQPAQARVDEELRRALHIPAPRRSAESDRVPVGV